MGITMRTLEKPTIIGRTRALTMAGDSRLARIANLTGRDILARTFQLRPKSESERETEAFVRFAKLHRKYLKLPDRDPLERDSSGPFSGATTIEFLKPYGKLAMFAFGFGAILKGILDVHDFNIMDHFKTMKLADFASIFRYTIAEFLIGTPLVTYPLIKNDLTASIKYNRIHDKHDDQLMAMSERYRGGELPREFMDIDPEAAQTIAQYITWKKSMDAGRGGA